MTKHSAVAAVKLSGLELVPKRKSRGKLASERDLAKFKFEPWVRSAALGPTELIPSDETMINCGVSARVAYAIMLRDREALIKSHGEVDHKHVDTMMAHMMDAAETLKSIVYMLNSAYTRMLASACTYNAKGGKFPGVHDMRKTKRVARRAR